MPTLPDVAIGPPPAPSTTGPTYTTRVLPPAEWEKLRALPFGSQGLPDPDLAIVIVDETQEGTIVGVWAIMLQPMLDGLWVDPGHRQTIIAGQLLRAMKAALQMHGIRLAFTVIQDAAVMSLAYKAGFERAPGDLWILRLPEQEG